MYRSANIIIFMVIHHFFMVMYDIVDTRTIGHALQSTSTLVVWHTGRTALCCARRRSCRHLATLEVNGGSGGRSSLCVRQHEAMIDHTMPGRVSRTSR